MEMQKEIDNLKRQLENSTRLQEDFSAVQVFDRDVVFNGNVYNRSGTKVIN